MKDVLNLNLTEKISFQFINLSLQNYSQHHYEKYRYLNGVAKIPQFRFQFSSVTEVDKIPIC